MFYHASPCPTASSWQCGEKTTKQVRCCRCYMLFWSAHPCRHLMWMSRDVNVTWCVSLFLSAIVCRPLLRLMESLIHVMSGCQRPWSGCRNSQHLSVSATSALCKSMNQGIILYYYMDLFNRMQVWLILCESDVKRWANGQDLGVTAHTLAVHTCHFPWIGNITFWQFSHMKTSHCWSCET